MGLRLTACVGVLAALFLLGAVKVEDGQFHFFPGGVNGPNLGVSVMQFGATGTDASDDTAAIQAASDTCQSPLIFPPGTFIVCGLFPRCPNQVWQGAGNGATILQATSACTNLINTGGTQGPAAYWELTGFTLRAGANISNIINMNASQVLRGNIHDNAFDLGFGQTIASLAGSGGSAGIAWSGGEDIRIDNNEFYSTVPGYGKAIELFRGTRHASITRNSWRWVYTGVELASVAGSEDVLIDGNTGDLGWYAEPVKFTGSGGNVTYAATTLTDTGATFAGLCNDDGAAAPQTCNSPAGEGNFVRVMTPEINASNTGSFSVPNLITDASANYTGAGVKKGDLIRTSLVCRGSGPKGAASRTVCTGSAGAGNWGDACACTTNADCASAICEKRFATVTNVNSATVLALDQWTSDVDRRPTSAPFNDSSTSIPTYTVFGWVMGQVASFTTTAITLGPNQTNWFDWFGTNSTPGAGTLYEVMTHHPNYNILVDPNAFVQKGRISANTLNRGHSDQIGLQSIASEFGWTVANNHIADGQDIGIDLFPAGSIAIGNVIEHQGTRGISMAANTSAYGNTVHNCTWTNNQNTTSLGYIQSNGSTSYVGNNLIVFDAASMPQARYGIVVDSASSNAVVAYNTVTGGTAFVTAAYRFNSCTTPRMVGYGGESVSFASCTPFFEGGRVTFAQLPTTAGNGSYLGCTDCTSTCGAGSNNGQNCTRISGGWSH